MCIVSVPFYKAVLMIMNLSSSISSARKSVCSAASRLTIFLRSTNPLLAAVHPLSSLSFVKDRQREEEEYKDMSIGVDLMVQVRTGEESKNHSTALASIFIHSDLLLRHRKGLFR